MHRQRLGAAHGDDGFRQRLDARHRVDHRHEIVAHDGLGRVRHRLRQHEDRRVDAGLAQAHAFFDERDTELRSTGVERGVAHGDRAMAVTIGLDDRHHARGCDDGSERAHVVAHGAQVYLGPYGPVARRGHVVRAMNFTMSPRATTPTTLPSASTNTKAGSPRRPMANASSAISSPPGSATEG